MEVKILHLYPDLMNLYGEYGNINILKSHLEDLGIQVFVDRKNLNEDFEIKEYDFIYCGSGTEKHMLMALEDLKKHKDDLKEYIDSNKVALFTGNSIEMLGIIIKEPKENVEALGLFDYEVQRLIDRKTSDIIFTSEIFNGEVVGFINKQANITKNDLHLFDVKFGIGENDENKQEGAYRNELYATYVIGPVFVRNPHVLRFFIEKIIHSIDKNFEIEDINYENEEAGYKLVLNELKLRKK